MKKVCAGLCSGIFLLLNCGETMAQKNAGNRPEPARMNFYVTLGLIWEGDHIEKINLDKIMEFRTKRPGIPFIQYLNPAYFTKKGADKNKIRSMMSGVMRSHDVTGLHLHPWKSLVTGAGLSYRQSPSVWGVSPVQMNCTPDCGHEVPLSAYRRSEISRMLQLSVETLRVQGFGRPEIFMAGAWMASPQVLEAVRGEGLKFDFSPVLPEFLGAVYRRYPLQKWLKHMWSGKDPAGPVSRYYTAKGSLIQAVQSVFPGLTLQREKDLQLFEHYIHMADRDPGSPYLFHISMHQETFFEFSDQLEEFTAAILKRYRPGKDFFWFRTPGSLVADELADLSEISPDFIPEKN